MRKKKSGKKISLFFLFFPFLDFEIEIDETIVDGGTVSYRHLFPIPSADGFFRFFNKSDMTHVSNRKSHSFSLTLSFQQLL